MARFRRSSKVVLSVAISVVALAPIGRDIGPRAQAANGVVLPRSLTAAAVAPAQVGAAIDAALSGIDGLQVGTPAGVVRLDGEQSAPFGGFKTFAGTGTAATGEHTSLAVVASEGAVDANLWVGTKAYRLETDANGVGRWGPPLPEREDIAVANPVGAAGDQAPVADQPPLVGDPASGPRLDLLVVYSPAALAYEGSLVKLYAHHVLNVVTANLALKNSAVTARYVLRSIQPVALTERGGTSGAQDDLGDARAGRGAFAQLPALRSSVGADMVILSGRWPDQFTTICGLGYQPSSMASFTNLGARNLSFSLMQEQCDALSMAHELGHNLGLAHDHETVTTNSDPVSFDPEGYGYVAPNKSFHTIMAYFAPCGGCPRIPYYANPDVRNSGTGLPTGQVGFANTARVIGVTAPFLDQYQHVAGSLFTPLPPVRVLDTRAGIGRPVGKVTGGGIIPVQLGGVGGVPAGAVGVVLNVTGTEPEANGFITVFPCDAALPGTSNLNYVTGQTVPNLVWVRLAKDGTVCFKTFATTHIVADVAGYFGMDGSALTPLNPVRLVDTRSLPFTAPLAGAGVYPIQVAGLAGVPVGATGVMLNATITAPAELGHLTFWPCDATFPVASNLNYRAGQTVANLVVVKLSADGKVCVRSHATTHLVLDVAGYFGGTGSMYSSLDAPGRLYDSRGKDKFEAGSSYPFTISGFADVPQGATGAVVNVTATNPEAVGFVTVFPCDIAPPLASNLNYLPGQTVPNLLAVRLDGTGRLCVRSDAKTDMIIDVEGYFSES